MGDPVCEPLHIGQRGEPETELITLKLMGGGAVAKGSAEK